MAKQTVAVIEQKPTLVARVKEFYLEVMSEMGKVTWPTKDELKSNTQVVLLVLAISAAITYFLDFFFQFAVVGLLTLL